jgi:predicted transcriptional regulator
MNPWGSDSSKRRDKLQIMAEILEIAADGALKTQIMYKGNLSFTQLNNYLEFMQEIDVLEKVEQNKRDIYRSTEKGLDFLERYREIAKLLKNEDNNPKNDVKIPPAHLLRRG